MKRGEREEDEEGLFEAAHVCVAEGRVSRVRKLPTRLLRRIKDPFLAGNVMGEAKPEEWSEIRWSIADAPPTSVVLLASDWKKRK